MKVLVSGEAVESVQPFASGLPKPHSQEASAQRSRSVVESHPSHKKTLRGRCAHWEAMRSPWQAT